MYKEKIDHGLHKDAFNLFKLVHVNEMANVYIDSLLKISNIRLSNLISSMKSRNKQFRRELREVLKGEFDNVFPELSTERIYLAMDFIDKTMFLSEEQIKEFVDSIQIVEKEN
jgi:hypothetical protein